MNTIGTKIKEVFPDIAILKDKDNYNVFDGRNLPSFVKDFLIRKFINFDGGVDRERIIEFLDNHIPNDNNAIKNRLLRLETVQLLSRFIIHTDIKSGKIQFAIPDAGIRFNEAIIPDY